MTFTNFLAGGILLVIGLINLTGKATFMMAGYNTMSPGNQARRDIKKISKFMGCILIIGALVLIIAGVLTQYGISSQAVLMGSWGFFLAIIIFGVVYMNVCKRFKIDIIQVDTASLSKRKGLSPVTGLIIGLVILVVVGGGVGYLTISSSKPPVYTVSDTKLKISGLYGETIAFRDIVTIQLDYYLPDSLFRTNGSAFGSNLKGNFESNSTKLKIFVDSSKPPFINLYTSTEWIIINDQSADKTQALYQELQGEISGGVK